MKNHFINKNKIIEAYISEPYKNSGEDFDFISTHGWQLHLVVAYHSDGYPIKTVIDKESEQACLLLAEDLGLTQIY